jgi:DNA-directed RNA polymerase specialized sigma24 family protein
MKPSPPRLAAERTPQGKSDADTRSSIIDGTHGRNAQWRWYFGCIRQMLGQAGCPEHELDDVAHDFIVDKLERVFLLYERKKGRFRGYLYLAVVNAWRDRQRSERIKDARHLDLGDAAELVSPVDSTPEDLLVLDLFFDRLFSVFSELTKANVGFVLLRDWCQSGRDIEETIRLNGLQITVEYARKARTEAVKGFASFVETALCPEDFASMIDEARERGDALGFTGDAKSIAGIFRWPSEKKRLGTVALLLRHLYLKYQREGADLDAG